MESTFTTSATFLHSPHYIPCTLFCRSSFARNCIEHFIRSLLFPTLFHFFKDQYHTTFTNVCVCVRSTLLSFSYMRGFHELFITGMPIKINIITFCHCVIQHSKRLNWRTHHAVNEYNHMTMKMKNMMPWQWKFPINA